MVQRDHMSFVLTWSLVWIFGSFISSLYFYYFLCKKLEYSDCHLSGFFILNFPVPLWEVFQRGVPWSRRGWLSGMWPEIWNTTDLFTLAFFSELQVLVSIHVWNMRTTVLTKKGNCANYELILAIRSYVYPKISIKTGGWGFCTLPVTFLKAYTFRVTLRCSVN